MKKILSSKWVHFSAQFCFAEIQTQQDCLNAQQSAAVTSLPGSIYLFELSASARRFMQFETY